MQRFIGTKIIQAEPMDRFHYCDSRGWDVPADEDGADEGYLIEYPDGYISWSPTKQFTDAYVATDGLPFGLAIEAMRKGHRVQRVGWNGKGMWVCLMPELNLASEHVNGRTKHFIGDADLECQPYFVMWTAAQQWQPGWLASQADMLALDWQIID